MVIRYIKLFDGYSLVTKEDDSVRAAFQFCSQEIVKRVAGASFQF